MRSFLDAIAPSAGEMILHSGILPIILVVVVVAIVVVALIVRKRRSKK